MLTQIAPHPPAGPPSDPPRAPSRAGFTRPQLRRQQAVAHLDWPAKIDESDDESDWEFASTLLLPFEPSFSDDSDFSSDDASEADSHDMPASKPLLPAHSVPISPDSVECPAVTEFAQSPSPVTVKDIHPYISLAVTDHGLSRSALSSLKEFWNARFDEYARIESQVIQNSAYGGIVEGNQTNNALRALLVSRLASAPTQQSSQANRSAAYDANPYAAIYPRTGNLAGLHDSRSATLDRAFCKYPLHSIHKTLFLHDMLQLATDTVYHTDSLSSADSDEDPQTPVDETFVDISLSSSTSDDNDDSLLTSSTSLCSSHGCRTRTCDDKHQPAVVHAVECTRQWELDWTERWKTLLDSTKDGSLCFRLSSYHVDEAAFLAALSPERPKTKFFFAEDEDEFSGLDDDEDYGLEVAQPVFMVTAETLSKEYVRSLGLDVAV
ncbi:hypothetical protein BC835DRAFT_1417484 [Cytidiella melzeri]|nr:hypothetical protein BC835DRAFT_1417484 [Cytidiella melzeri]